MNLIDQSGASGKNRQEHDQELAELKHLLRQSMPPLSADQLEPSTDLWPQLRARIDSQLSADRANSQSISKTHWAGMRVPWFDWALAALATAALLFFPGIIPALLYHF